MRTALVRAIIPCLLAVAIARTGVARAGCAPADRAWISEVLYDAAGDDTGFEFVELANPTDHPVSLAGVRLEAGDGAAPGRWTTRWTGDVGDVVASHAWFVIGGARVSPPADRVVTLELQNGPDAVRLVWPDGAIETLGYGALDYAEYSCGAPAPDVVSGTALARIPDDADSGSDARDFRAAPPTPGRANQPARDLAMVPGSLTLAPAHPRVAEPAVLSGRVVSRGREDLPAGLARLDAGWMLPPDTVWAASAPLPALASGDTATLALTLLPPEGRVTMCARVVGEGDADRANDLDTLRVRIGAGPLALTEVQFHPADDAGEWVEVLAWTRGAVDPAGFTLRDRGGTTATARGGRVLSPGERAVLAQRRDAFVSAHPGLDTSRVMSAAPWPSLNNSDAADGIADALTLAEPDGAPSDAMGYSAAGVPAGAPIERVDDAHWQASPTPGGTPLEPPRAAVAIGGRFEARPTRLSAASARATLAWALPFAWADIEVRAFDLDGREAGIVLARALRAGRGEGAWDPAALPPGVYVLMLTASPEGGGPTRTETTPVRIVRRVP